MKDKYKSTVQHFSSLETGSSSIHAKKSTLDHSRSSSYDKPTPLDFDTFVPWVCLKWQSPVTVVVTRMALEDYIGQENRRSASSRSRSSKSLKFKRDDETDTKTSEVTTGVTGITSKPSDFAVPVKAYYDNAGHLAEIAIIDCPIDIHRKVIQAFSICLPFHPLLTKLTIRKRGLNADIIHEIAKLLPHSNLTDVCLDNCVLPYGTGNYECLLEKSSTLKHLSLNKCSIDDSICKSLAAKIDIGYPGSSILVLELGSNLITDIGARAIGESLRRNRHLLHLNLSGNKITDDGASSILSQLMEFKLTWEEIYNARQRKLKYTEKKMVAYANCYEEVLKQQRLEMTALSTSSRKFTNKGKKNANEEKNKRSRKSQTVFADTRSVVEIAAAMTMDIVGKFNDPFAESQLVQKEESVFSNGNTKLCSLNLAYNNLSFISIQKMHDVLNYQSKTVKPPGATGLMRIVFYGNDLPEYCVFYDRIDMFLKKVVEDNTSFSNILKKKSVTIVSKKSLK